MMIALYATALLVLLTKPATAMSTSTSNGQVANLVSAEDGTEPALTQGHLRCIEDKSRNAVHILAMQHMGQYIKSEDASKSTVFEMDLAAAAAGPVNIIAKTGPFAWNHPFLGVIDRRESIGSQKYFYLGGVKRATEPEKSSTLGRSAFTDIYDMITRVQTSIWRYDAESGYLTPNVVDDEGQVGIGQVYYLPNSRVIIARNATSVENGATSCRLSFRHLVKGRL